jgi:hypothetical protein
MQWHECNKHNYLFINNSLKFYFLMKIRVLLQPFFARRARSSSGSRPQYQVCLKIGHTTNNCLASI